MQDQIIVEMVAVLSRTRRWLFGTVAPGDDSYRRIGKCPKRTLKIRHCVNKRNTHDCTGDETCIAKQDLLLAIDGSGSLREFDPKILRDSAASLIDKYTGQLRVRRHDDRDGAVR